MMNNITMSLMQLERINLELKQFNYKLNKFQGLFFILKSFSSLIYLLY
jgi:hypothetical protein